jgi:uncharacterized protein (TIGR03545 family)
MFRWKGIIVIIVLVAIVFVLSLLLTDRWLESALENTGSSIVGAKVEIDGLDLSLLDMKVHWDRLQVTHPQHTMKNMFETDTSEFDLEFWPLLSKKVIVENFQIHGIKTFTDRKTDGALTKEEKEKQPGYIRETMNQLSSRVENKAEMEFGSVKQKLNVDSIMALLDIRSVGKIDSLNKSLTAKYSNWDQRLSSLNVEKDLKEVEAKIKSIDVNQIKKPDQLQASLKTAKEIKSKIESVSDEFNSTKKDLLSDINSASSSLKSVDDWISEDYKRAREKAKLPDISMQSIAEVLFGSEVVNRINQYLGYAATARTYSEKFKSTKPEKKKPPRLKGQDIYFYNKNARPEFWIKQISLSGETNAKLKIKGDIKDIVSDQRQIQKPTTIDLSGTGASGAKLSFTGEMNYLGEEPQEQFNLGYAGFSLANTKLSDSRLLPNEISKGSGTINTLLNLNGENIDGKIKFTSTGIVFKTSESKPKNQVERIIQDVVKSINAIDFQAKIKGRKDDLTLSISSNLDELLVNNLKSTVNKEIEAAKQKLKAKVDSEVSKHKANLEEHVKSKEAEYKAIIAKYESMIETETDKAKAKQKEIEDKIEAEKKKLEGDAKDKLKKLFK